MRKLMLSLVFVLGAMTMVSANSNKKGNSDLQKLKTEIIINSPNELLKDCKLTIKNNQTGDSYTITIHGKSCAEYMKEMMKK